MRFMEGVAKQYPTGNVTVVWDNLNIHHGPAWEAFSLRHGGRFRSLCTPLHAAARVVGEPGRDLVQHLEPHARRGSRCRRTPPASSLPREGGSRVDGRSGRCSGCSEVRVFCVGYASLAAKCAPCREVTAAAQASQGQLRLRAFSARARLRTPTSGRASCAPEGECNGCDLDGRIGLVDDLGAAGLHHGGGTARGTGIPHRDLRLANRSPWPRLIVGRVGAARVRRRAGGGRRKRGFAPPTHRLFDERSRGLDISVDLHEIKNGPRRSAEHETTPASLPPQKIAPPESPRECAPSIPFALNQSKLSPRRCRHPNRLLSRHRNLRPRNLRPRSPPRWHRPR